MNESPEERKCFQYTAPPQQVVYDDDPASSKSLIASDQGLVKIGPAVVRPIRYWNEFYKFDEYPSDPQAHEPILFLHQRQTPGGAAVLLAVTFNVRGGNQIDFDVLTPHSATPYTPPGRRGSSYTFPIKYLPGTHLRFYAGQPDPNDRSRFTIGCAVNGRQEPLRGGFSLMGKW